MAAKRLALKVAYDGARFHGSQRQPRVRTVEGDLLAALAAIGAGPSAEALAFKAASRTDRGVSAAGNVYAVTTDFRPGELAGAVNAHVEDAWVVAVAEAPPGFNPRHARRRRYRYLLHRDAAPPEPLARALRLFEGTHDFSSFARVEPGVNPVRTLESVTVDARGPYHHVDLAAPSFLWNQVRRMVAAAVAVARGAADPDAVRGALAGKGSVDLGVAAPEPLVLLEVEYDGLAFPRASAPPGLAAARHRARLDAAVLDTLARVAPAGRAGAEGEPFPRRGGAP